MKSAVLFEARSVWQAEDKILITMTHPSNSFFFIHVLPFHREAPCLYGPAAYVPFVILIFCTAIIPYAYENENNSPS